MELTDEPWVGLLWDKTNQRMISEKIRQKVAKHILFYMIGGNLEKIKTNEKDLRQEYAGLLNREESEVNLRRSYSSFS